MIKMTDATAPTPDYVLCERGQGRYCLDMLAGAVARIIDMCGPCRAMLITTVDIHVRPLQWAPELLDGALDPPQELVADKRANIALLDGETAAPLPGDEVPEP